MLKKKFYLFKIIISILGIILMIYPVHFFFSIEFPKFFLKEIKHSCNYYRIDPNGLVSCKTVLKVSEEKNISCGSGSLKDNHLWFEVTDWNQYKILQTKLKLDKEFLDRCFDK